MNQPSDVANLLPIPLNKFPRLPDSVRKGMPSPGLAFPRVRALFYFGDVMRSPAPYDLAPQQAVLFEAKIREAIEVQCSHALAVAMEIEFRATVRLIVQPPAVEAFVRRVLVDSDFPQILLAPRDSDHATINLESLLWRLRTVHEAENEFLYVRKDVGTGQNVRWAYYVDVQWHRYGPRSRRYSGRCANPAN